MKISIHLLRVPQAVAHAAVQQLQTEQLIRFKQLNGRRANTFFYGRLLLGHLLRERMDETWRLEEQDSLPPRLVSRTKSPPSFCISHSGEWLAIAVSDHADEKLGLDLERIKPSREPDTAKIFCNKTQMAWLQSLSEKEFGNSLTQLWTQKEAWFKARQTSIFNPQLTHLNMDPTSIVQANIASAEFDQDYWLSVHAEDVTQITCHLESVSECPPWLSKSTSVEPKWRYFQGYLSCKPLRKPPGLATAWLSS